MCVGVTPNLPSCNPNASRADERPVQLIWTDGHVIQMNGHMIRVDEHDDNPDRCGAYHVTVHVRDNSSCATNVMLGAGCDVTFVMLL